MSNKRLNEDSIVNELKDGSLFFQRDGKSADERNTQNRAKRPPKAAPDFSKSQRHIEPPATVPSLPAPFQSPTGDSGKPTNAALSPPSHLAGSNTIETHQQLGAGPSGTGRPALPTENVAEIRGEARGTDSPGIRPYDISPARTTVRIKRNFSRYAFEFFQDQIETLKGFSLEEQLRGEKGNMSQMVREALDAYISKRKRTEE